MIFIRVETSSIVAKESNHVEGIFYAGHIQPKFMQIFMHDFSKLS